MSDTTLCPILPAHQFNQESLHDYLRNKIPGLNSTIDIQQFQGGQSNPTFLLDSPAGKYVLRKKPPGKLLHSAHMVEREYKVLDALQSSKVPVPKTWLLCEDDSIIGTPFYIMSYTEGEVFIKPELDTLDKPQRGKLYSNMAKTLADLHRFDWQNSTLHDFGKPDGFYERQIRRWSKQFEASIVDLPDAEAITPMRQLIEWLPNNIPSDNATSIAHGDYRVGNLIVNSQNADINAVLDWELSTIGHPLADLAYLCIPWYLPHGGDGVKGIKGLDMQAFGIPTLDSFIQEYCQHSGRTDIIAWNFYVAFSLFRLAAILQGVYARAIQGNASSENGLIVGARASLMATTAWEVAQGKHG